MRENANRIRTLFAQCLMFRFISMLSIWFTNMSNVKDVFRTQLNIHNGAFLRKFVSIYGGKSFVFLEKHSEIDVHRRWVLNTLLNVP